jgi:hypothetical protein
MEGFLSSLFSMPYRVVIAEEVATRPASACEVSCRRYSTLVNR